MTIKIPLVTENTIPAHNIRSLAWDGETLVDWAGGGNRYSLDGNCVRGSLRYEFPFDGAVVSPDGRYAAVYPKLGTRGLLLDQGKILREIHRGDNHAKAYEYPITFWTPPDGRVALIHCPDRYDRLEIDDVATGQRLTSSETRDPRDFFHSRLSISPCGRYLKSAGWVWHPADSVLCFDLRMALDTPEHLDGHGFLPWFQADDSSAAFDPASRLWVAVEGDAVGEVERNELHVLSPDSPESSTVFAMSTKVGTILPLGDRHLLNLHDHPKLIAVATGEVIQAWPHIASGKQTSSIIWHGVHVPPTALALDPPRVAIAAEDRISVLRFDI